MDKTKQILEALQMQPLSDEEKQSRHILGRLYGPIATCEESTRNGRKYNRDLWEKALADDIFKEKINNKSLFLELGHPADREETDMEKVCACIPEMPKIVDGDLYAYVDILDTNNGRLLQTLCEYGFVPGISSRGSGDIMENDEVDPDTFFLETWDIVQLPAVKKARLTVCESMDTKALKLRKALKESYDNSNEEDKKLMKETLDNLNINFIDTPLCEDINKLNLREEFRDELLKLTDKLGIKTLAELDTWSKAHGSDKKDFDLIKALQKEVKDKKLDEATLPGGTDTNIKNIPWDTEFDIEPVGAGEDKILVDSLTEETEGEPAEEVDVVETAEDEEKVEEPVEVEVEETEEVIDDKEVVDEEPIEEPTALTIGELAETIDGFDKDLPVEFANVVIDDKEYTTEVSIEDGEGKVIIGVNCTPVEGEASEDKEVEDEVDSDDEVAEVELEDESEEAIDDGNEEVIESLKEAIRQKDALEKEVKTLRNEKTVGDAEVKTLKEEVEKYKTAFERTSELASKSTKLEAANKALQESINTKDTEIKKLQSQASEATKLNESIEHNATKVKKLTEQLKAVQDEAEEHSKALEEQLAQCKQKLHERTILAKKFKAKSSEVLDRYIESKASMLGVRATEITSRLNENYTMDDIEKVCDDLLTGGVQNTLPFNLGRNTTVKVRESVERKQPTISNPDYGYEIDDDLFELAGLKKDQF